MKIKNLCELCASVYSVRNLINNFFFNIGKTKIILVLYLFLFSVFIYPQNNYFTTPTLLVPYLEDAPEIVSVAAVMIDAKTGALLYSKNPHWEIPPASLTKLMTMHLVMNEIKAGRASYEEIIPVTEASWAQSQPRRSSLMFLAPGQTVTLREILLGLAVPSGNDAAVAAALRLAPDMQTFAEMMTDEARRMGMTVTRFTEASGISRSNITTAAEFAHFSRQYINLHPEALIDFHSVLHFAYPLAEHVPEAYRERPRTIVQNNGNSLLRTFPGTDGLKTGYIAASGYNLALTAQRDNTRFIYVTLGATSPVTRHYDGMNLLTWAFDNFKTVNPPVQKIENVRLYKGRENTVKLIPSKETAFTSPKSRANKIWQTVILDKPLVAPLPESYPAGHIIIYDEKGELTRIPLVTESAYEKGNVFKRVLHSIRLFF